MYLNIQQQFAFLFRYRYTKMLNDRSSRRYLAWPSNQLCCWKAMAGITETVPIFLSFYFPGTIPFKKVLAPNFDLGSVIKKTS